MAYDDYEPRGAHDLEYADDIPSSDERMIGGVSHARVLTGRTEGTHWTPAEASWGCTCGVHLGSEDYMGYSGQTFEEHILELEDAEHAGAEPEDRSAPELEPVSPALTPVHAG
ncbi:hypothetical protein Bequi_13455 [Brachybacterium sp. JHP9]|uniref:Uncharacterized protein n=1 Tax=Brachybacterium equifaecis TaxID=2910770 RepID=A0ABT0R3B1_9MICO|nr:hypothetical protein [Brachybacterium equifaecis]MCL6424371.1 hypothetical protein [Brachybacterium equifaecis]